MKRRFYILLLALLILPCALLFTGCKKMDRYSFAIMPDDQYYSADVTRVVKQDGVTATYTFDFARTTATIAGEERNVMYLDYSYVRETINTHYTLLFVQGDGLNKAFYLNNANEWKRDNDSYSSRWNYAYGNYNDFMYKTDVWGRDFIHDTLKETDEYLEYTFTNPEETFRLANNPYHYLVYYHYKAETLEKTHNANVTIAKPTRTIQYLSTLTAEELAK